MNDKLIEVVGRALGKDVRVQLPVGEHDGVGVDVPNAGQVLGVTRVQGLGCGGPCQEEEEGRGGH